MANPPTGTAAPKPPTRAWVTAGLGGMASYMDSAMIVSTGTALVLFQPSLGLGEWTIGALSALLTLSLAAGALVGGRLGDRFGRRRIFTLVLLLLAVGAALLAGSVSVPMLYAGVIIAGFAMGADIPTSLALIAETAPPEKRGRMVAFSQFLWMVGIVVATILGYLVSEMGEVGARILYGHVVLVAVVVVVLRRGISESTEWDASRRESAKSAAAGDGLRGDSLRRLLRGPLLAGVVATGLYYGISNLAANTMGQFQTYLFVHVAGAEVSTATLISMIAMPVGLVSMLGFMRVADSRFRMHWFAFGAILMVTGPLVPLVLGFGIPQMTAMAIALGVGGGFAGEGIYKVWSQELFPTLVRGTAQGTTIAFTRTLAAGFAFITPALAEASPTALLALLSSTSLVAMLIGGFWIPRLPKAVDTPADASPSSAAAETTATGPANATENS